MTIAQTLHCNYLTACTAAPYALLHSLEHPESKSSSLFLHYTQKALDTHTRSFFFFKVSNETYYHFCHRITWVAFGALGIAFNVAITLWALPYLFSSLALTAFFYYKFIPLFTEVFKERLLTAAYDRQVLIAISHKEKELHAIPQHDLDHRLLALGISSEHFYNLLYQTPFLKGHPESKQIAHAILIHTLARYECLQESKELSIKDLTHLHTLLAEVREKIKKHDEKGLELSLEERAHLEEEAEKLFMRIYELHEFDLPEEQHTSVLAQAIQAAYLLHLMKDPLQTPTYPSLGKTLPKQSFERKALKTAPSAQAFFFLEKGAQYIPKKFFIEHLQKIPEIEKRLFP
jgi:hypothetical protein